MESEMFLQTALDGPNQIKLAEQIEVSAQATFLLLAGKNSICVAKGRSPNDQEGIC
jgi:hypothetical protein